MEFDDAVLKPTVKYLYQYWLAHDVSDQMSFDEFLTHMKSIIEVSEDDDVSE